MEGVDTRAEDVISALRREVPCSSGCGSVVEVEDVMVEEATYCDECLWYLDQQRAEEEAAAEREHRYARERYAAECDEEAMR